MVKVKPNIGIINALIRITIGLTILSWCTAKQVRKPYHQSYLWVAICGAMKVAEGIVRFCPVTAYFEQCNMPNSSPQKRQEHESEANQSFNETVPSNPT